MQPNKHFHHRKAPGRLDVDKIAPRPDVDTYSVDESPVIVVGRDGLKHHRPALAVEPLPTLPKCYIHLHATNANATGTIRIPLNEPINRASIINLQASCLEGYTAGSFVQVFFEGQEMSSGMRTRGTTSCKRHSIIIPTAYTNYGDEGMEIARWYSGGGTLNSLNLRVQDMTGADITVWTDLYLWMQVQQISWS